MNLKSAADTYPPARTPHDAALSTTILRKKQQNTAAPSATNNK
jgi:hypothetical protein